MAGIPSGLRAMSAVWRSAHRHPRVTLVGLGGLVVALAAVLAVLHTANERHAEVDQARSAGKAAGEKMAVTLLSYDYRAPADDLQRREALLTGHFKDEYATLMKDTVLPAATKQQVTTQTSVAMSSVISADGPDRVTLLLFLNQTTQSAASKEPVLNGSRVRMTVQRTGGQWRVSELTPV